MKFISVFVLYIYVRTAYSYYMGSPSNPIPQNTDASKLPAYVQNAYPSPQETINYQPVPIQQEYKIGPGIPFPVQIAATDPGIQNGIQMGQPYNGVSRQPSAVQNIASNLKNIYKTSVPKKRYTIVHPNGTIEHTDDINSVTARYNNYLMVKATDILAHFNQPNMNNGASQNILPNQLNKPITTTNQNAEWTSTNSYKEPYINDFRNSASNENPIDQRYRNLNIQESTARSPDIPSNPNIGSSNPAGMPSEEIINEQNIQEINKVTTDVTENIAKEENYNSFITQESHSNVVAANPVPIYPATSVAYTVEKTEQPSKSLSANDNYTVTPSIGDAVSMTDLNSTDSSTSKRPTTTVQLPAEKSEHKTLQVILPKMLQESITQETQTPTTIEDPKQSQTIPEITTIEEATPQQNANIATESNNTESSESAIVLAPNAILDIRQSNDSLDEPADTSETSANTTTTFNIDEKPSDVSEESTSLGVSDQSSTAFGNGKPLTWFHLSEESVWEAIRSNASNVYFFFLPPKPKRYKEIRTTIYPNGTTVEEIIERDVDENKDGSPRVTKNATS